MSEFIKNVFIGLLASIVTASNYTKCMPGNYYQFKS